LLLVKKYLQFVNNCILMIEELKFTIATFVLMSVFQVNLGLASFLLIFSFTCSGRETHELNGTSFLG